MQEVTSTKASNTRVWQALTDLPGNWDALASAELKSLMEIWREESQRLKDTEALRQFNERLTREWAIETGIIEGLYSIDRGITVTLIEKGLEAALLPHGSTDKAPELVIRILRDHKSVLDGLFDFVRNGRQLTTGYIKEIHAQLTKNQATTEVFDQFGNRYETDLIRGDWKKLPNNPTRQDGAIHEYCPPIHVASEMEKLVELHRFHERAGVPIEIEAAWLHHRFTQIHPFQDGNGRVARALASLVLIKGGAFPLTVSRDSRSEYISALETADRGDLQPLIGLFVSIQKRAFLTAISTSKEVLDSIIPVQELLESAVERLQAKYRQDIEKQNRVFDVEARLRGNTLKRLTEIQQQMTRTFAGQRGLKMSAVASSAEKEEHKHYYKGDAIEIARSLGYYADINRLNDWCRLWIGGDQTLQTMFVVSFHSIGDEFIGLLGATAFVKFRNFDDAQQSTWSPPVSACSELFQFAFNEEDAEVDARFSHWLNTAILVGLDQWRRQL